MKGAQAKHGFRVEDVVSGQGRSNEDKRADGAVRLIFGSAHRTQALDKQESVNGTAL